MKTKALIGNPVKATAPVQHGRTQVIQPPGATNSECNKGSNCT